MLRFLIILWLIVALIVEIPQLINEFKSIIKGVPENIDDFLLY